MWPMATFCVKEPSARCLFLRKLHPKPMSVEDNIMPILQMTKLRLTEAK